MIRKHKCLDCNDLVSYKAKRCNKCASIERAKHGHNVGEKNGQWKEEPKLIAIHNWVRRRKLKPEFCEECKKEKPKDLANVSGDYIRNINDFRWLCRRCHMKSDGRMNNLFNGRKKCIICLLPFKENEQYTLLKSYNGGVLNGVCFYHMDCWNSRFAINKENINEIANQWMNKILNMTGGEKIIEIK